MLLIDVIHRLFKSKFELEYKFYIVFITEQHMDKIFLIPRVFYPANMRNYLIVFKFFKNYK